MSKLKMFSGIGIVAVALTVALGQPAAHEDSKAPHCKQDYYDGTAPNPAKSFFDLTPTDPGMMRDYLTVINSTYDTLVAKGTPRSRISFVLSLRLAAVTFLTKDFGAGTANEAVGQEIRQLLTTLMGKGVRVEACVISLQWMGVATEDLLGGIVVIDNAFISSTWYQSKGYALLPVFQP